MSSQPIYLDYMSTTPVDPRVIAKMHAYLGIEGIFGNASSLWHDYGKAAKHVIDKARAQVAALIHATPESIIWTSGATEAINLAIKGAALFYQRRGRHLITMQTEHKAVLACCEALQRQGWDITYLAPQPNGLLAIESLEAAFKTETVLVSFMQANNETGVIQDIARIGKLVKQKGCLFHVDAAQSAGKIPIDVDACHVDLLSLSAHKFYGPKGIGALYIRTKPRVHLEPLLHGGEQEYGLRSGTLPTHQIMAMGEACEIANNEMAAEATRISALQQSLWQRLQALTHVYLNGDETQRIPHNLNISFAGIDGEALIMGLAKHVALSAGSACTSASLEPSHVLKAMQLSPLRARSALRISLGRFTTSEDIEVAAMKISAEVQRLREISPLWPLQAGAENEFVL